MDHVLLSIWGTQPCYGVEDHENGSKDMLSFVWMLLLENRVHWRCPLRPALDLKLE